MVRRWSPRRRISISMSVLAGAGSPVQCSWDRPAVLVWRSPPATTRRSSSAFPQTLSGPASNFGKDDQIAFTMALEDVNKAGGIEGRPLQFNFIDGQGQDRRARARSCKR